MNDSYVPLSQDNLRHAAEMIDTIADWLPDLDDPKTWAHDVHVDVRDDGGQKIGEIRAHGDGWWGFWPMETL